MRDLSSFGLSVRVMAALIITALGVTSCVKKQDSPVISAPIVVAEPGIFHPEKWPASGGNVRADNVEVRRAPDAQARINNLIARMTLRQKIGALIAVDEQYISPQDLSTYPVGLIISGRYEGGAASLDKAGQYYNQALRADLDGGPFVPPLRLLDIYAAAQSEAMTATMGEALGYAAPIALGAAARGSGGSEQSTHFTQFVRNIGAAQSAQARRGGFDGVLWRHMEAEIQTEIQGLENDGAETRRGLGQPSGFDRLAPRAAQTGAALLAGGLYGQAGPGRSLVAAGPILGTYILPEQSRSQNRFDEPPLDKPSRANIDIDEDRLIELHGARLTSLMGAAGGADEDFAERPDIIMLTPQIWQGTALMGDPVFIQDYLRGRLGFEGVIMGARDGHASIEGCTASDCLEALSAGLDIYYAGENWRELFDNLLRHVVMRRLDVARLDAALGRILFMKFESGAFTNGEPAMRRPAESLVELSAGLGPDKLGPKETSLINLARSSAVLVKNRRRVLPLSPLDHIAILLPDPSLDVPRERISPITVALEGSFIEAIGRSEGRVSRNDLPASQSADIALIILDASLSSSMGGAEMGGISSTQMLKEQVQNLQGRNIPIVLIIASQTMPRLTEGEAAIFDMAQGVVLAWHPSGATQGIADLVFASKTGQIIYDFTAKLPFDAKLGDTPFLEVGFGLSYFE